MYTTRKGDFTAFTWPVLFIEMSKFFGRVSIPKPDFKRRQPLLLLSANGHLETIAIDNFNRRPELVHRIMLN